MVAKWKNNKLAALATGAERPLYEGLKLGDLFARHAGMIVPKGFPDGFKDTEFRQQLRARVADDMRKMKHDDLALLAAAALEEMLLWKSAFANYAKDKDIELIETKAEMSQKLCDAYAEALDILADPSTRGYLNAQAKLARDPKQAARMEAKKLWQERYEGKHPKLGTNEQFATEVMRRWPVLKSSKVICGWCTEWNKQAKRKNQSAS